MEKPDSDIYRNDSAFEKELFQNIRRRDCSEFYRESGQMYMNMSDPDDKQPKEKKPKYKYKGW